MKTKKSYRLFSALVVILALVAVFGAYRVYYRPLEKQIKKVETDIARKEAEYKDYLSAKWQPKVWKKTVEDASSLNGFDTMPKSLREQDQITFVASLEKAFGISTTDIKFGKSAPVGGTSVMSKALSFGYRVSSYEELCSLIKAICHDVTFPSSVVDFTLEIDDDGAFHGVMNVKNYYDPEKGKSLTENATGAASGVKSLFINE